MALRILVVCTGNVCRSPMAERLLAAGVREHWGVGAEGVEVTSAGTAALVGEPMTPQTAELVARHGGETQGHVARQVTEELVASADLVLTATRAHRAAVVQLRPASVRRVFTLREAARLAAAASEARATSGAPDAAASPEERLEGLLLEMRAARQQTACHQEDSEDDVLDPYSGSDKMYERSSAEIVPAVQTLVGALSPGGVPA